MKAFFARKNKSVFLLRAVAAAAAAAQLITSARGDADAQDGGGGGGGGDSVWDEFPDVITSCDFGGGREWEFGGTLTFLRSIHCTTPTVSFFCSLVKGCAFRSGEEEGGPARCNLSDLNTSENM